MEQVSAPLVLSLDLGTSSARAALFDGTGQRCTEPRRVHYELRTTPDGGAELDPTALATAVEGLLDALLQEVNQPVDAVALSTFWHSLLGADAQGQPTTAVLTWADTRAAAVIHRLRDQLDPATHHARTGAFLHPSYPVARLAWLRETLPDVWRRTRHWLAFPDWLFLRWFGEPVSSISMASGSGLFAQSQADWDQLTLEAIGLSRDSLPMIADEPLTSLRAAYRTRWPALAAARWFPAWGDGACNNVGSGAVGLDRLSLMIGTSGAMRLLWQAQPFTPPDGLWLYRLDRDWILLGGALSEGGGFIDWLFETLQLPDRQATDAALANHQADQHGLLWLPFIAGERSPGWAGAARATLTGLHLQTRPLAILQAAFESVACRFALVARAIAAAVPGERTLIGSGNGLAAFSSWQAILADAIGLPLSLVDDPEASLRGAALVALARLGVASLPALARPLADSLPTRLPNPDRRAYYDDLITRQQALYAVLVDKPYGILSGE